MLYDSRGEFSQRSGKDIGHNHIEPSLDVFRRGHHCKPVLHAVTGGIAAGCENRLRIDVHCVHVLAAELERGDRQHAGTAAVIE